MTRQAATGITHLIACDHCRVFTVVTTVGFGIVGVVQFVERHDDCNYPTGLRIEKFACPSPRRSDLYTRDN